MHTMNDEQDIQPMGAADALHSEKGADVDAVPGGKNGPSVLFTYRTLKGVMDRTSAFIALLVLSPLLAVIAIVTRLDSPGNAIFRQDRVGKGGRKFIFYKFRSMYTDHDDSEYYRLIEKYVRGESVSRPSHHGAKRRNDPRITRVGRVLRKTNLDELPQLFNILKGDMSFVGPRPMIPFMVEMYNDHHKKCFEVKPGLTGLWQASGRKKLSFEDMIRLDLDYINNQSLFLDIKIIILTARAVLNGEGS